MYYGNTGNAMEISEFTNLTKSESKFIILKIEHLRVFKGY